MPELDVSYVKSLEMLVASHAEKIRQTMSDLETAHNGVLGAYGQALWLKNPAVADHSKRVTAFCIALGQELKLSGHQIREIARACYLHDVGKLSIPDSVLTKREPFSVEEMELMQRHPVSGYELIKEQEFLTGVAELVLAHHERWDGKGYPNGLQGESIPLGARMIAVANVFDHISYNQVSGEVQPIESAMQMIAKDAGSKFDPHIVETFLAIPPSRLQDIQTEIQREAAAHSRR